MDDVALHEAFTELFRGNGEAYGLEHGECVREPLTEALVWEHLFGDGSVGVYPTIRLTSGTIQHDPAEPGASIVCRWGCSDIDTHGPRALSAEEGWIAAGNLRRALKVLGHTAWVELTKGAGYHVWVFSTAWVPATWVRNTFLLAHQLTDVPATEVNPKDAEGRTELGNYVNLPYSDRWAVQGRRVVLDEEGAALPTRRFVSEALQARSVPAAWGKSSGLYVPPAPRPAVTLRPFQGAHRASEGAGTLVVPDDLKVLTDQLNGKAWVIFRDGPMREDGTGRGFALFRLALECKESGLGPDDTLTLLSDADWRWGKYQSGVDGHTDGIRYLEDIVRKVF